MPARPSAARPPLARRCVLAGAVLLAMTSAAAALAAEPQAVASSNWPRWRGPSDQGSSDLAGDYPAKWDITTGTNVAWKVELPGKGTSTPAVWGERVFVTTPADGDDAVLALNLADGKEAWRAKLGPERPGKHRNGSGSNPSPATDGTGVFVFFKSGTLAALDADTGKVRWKTNLLNTFGKEQLYWDLGTSPALTADNVVMAMMHGGESYVVALDKRTGQQKWKTPRNYKTPIEGDHGYTTPIVVRHAGKEAVLVWGAQHLTAYDAAEGTLLWTVGDFNPASNKNWVAVSSPVVVGDVAVVPYGRGTRLHGIKLGGTGDVTKTHRLWVREDTGTFVPTPAAAGGKAILVRDAGEVEAVDPLTGKTEWKGALPKSSSKFYASPAVAGGKIYAAREDGVVFVASADGKVELLGQNDLGERVAASPVPLAGGRVLLRGEKHLVCVK
ncbi:MAG TPA: PQQ-binding-like beta-propeller repeat protein [Humisphaera sp.]